MGYLVPFDPHANHCQSNNNNYESEGQNQAGKATVLYGKENNGLDYSPVNGGMWSVSYTNQHKVITIQTFNPEFKPIEKAVNGALSEVSKSKHEVGYIVPPTNLKVKNSNKKQSQTIAILPISQLKNLNKKEQKHITDRASKGLAQFVEIVYDGKNNVSKVLMSDAFLKGPSVKANSLISLVTLEKEKTHFERNFLSNYEITQINPEVIKVDENDYKQITQEAERNLDIRDKTNAVYNQSQEEPKSPKDKKKKTLASRIKNLLC